MPKRRSQPWVGPWRSWYQLESWRRRRRAQLRDEPLCAMCAHRGLVRAATIADHVQHHNGDLSAFLTGALVSLCRECHEQKHGRMRVPVQIGADGWPQEESPRLI